MLQGEMYRTEFGGIYLGIAVSIVPILIVYAFISRYIISGIMMGGLKE
jgi:multiple sugar transport system permease protein